MEEKVTPYNPAQLEIRRTVAFEGIADALTRIADVIDNWKVKKDGNSNIDRSGVAGTDGDDDKTS